ncbi:MAG: carbohydrate kinase family protein [Beijerinckiaceae bacterium]
MFLVCGEAVIDLFGNPAELSFRGQPAGSPFNVAVGLARMDCQTSFVTGLSQDAFGRQLIAALEAEGVDSSLAPRTERPTILSFIMVKPDGSPDYAFYGDNGADLQVTAEAFSKALPESIKAVHVGGFPMAVSPSKEAYAALIKREANQRFVSLDPNIRTKLIGDIDVFRDHFEGLCQHAALIKASSEDVEHLYAGVDTMTIAKRWRTLGAGTVIMTDGGRGAFALNQNGVTLEKSTPVTVKDTVGAGDSFMSATLAALQDHNLLDRARLASATAEQLRKVLQFANRAAGITCTRQGANPPTRAALLS